MIAGKQGGDTAVLLQPNSRWVECDQYDPGRLMTVDDSQRVSGTLRAVDGAGSLKCHLAENYPDPVIENAKNVDTGPKNHDHLFS